MQHSLDIRSWNGTKISRRTTDGFVNATAMCRANGKQWNDYFRTDRATLYMEALVGSAGNPADLVTTISTGSNEGRGTWVHPQVAVDLARWISAPFAVWMDGWFLERVSQVRDTQPVPALPEEVQRLEWLMSFCDRWDIELDDRDRLHIKEHARTLALPPAGQGQTVFNDYPVSRLVQDLFGVVLTNKHYSAIGRKLAEMWRSENSGAEPQKHDQYVDGACRKTAHYPREWAEPALKTLERTRPDLFQR